jgi:cytochrome c peroxidase
VLAAGCMAGDELDDVGDDPPPAADAIAKQPSGRKVFEDETFDGNGRTCRTCHTRATGALTPADVEAAFAADPGGALFRSIDSDDGVGASFSRLRSRATILVDIPLPPGWSIEDDPDASFFRVARAVPTVLNVPALDDLLMADGRFAALQDQALGAVHAHAEPGREPTAAELDAVAEFQRGNDFFSTNELKHFAGGGPAPVLPPGTTPEEIRGRAWMVPSVPGVCGHCHGCAMLNETTEFLLAPFPPGTRFFTAFVSELNKGGNPVTRFVVDTGGGTSTIVESTDPGRALITGSPLDANFFRIPTLWGVKDTAPYFHDNSAADLDALGQHYSDYFVIVGLPPLSAQDIADINAYLRLL